MKISGHKRASRRWNRSSDITRQRRKGRFDGAALREHGQNTDKPLQTSIKALFGNLLTDYNATQWAVSSAVRASGLHPEGPAFKSLTAHQISASHSLCYAAFSSADFSTDLGPLGPTTKPRPTFFAFRCRHSTSSS